MITYLHFIGPLNIDMDINDIQATNKLFIVPDT